MLANVKRRGFLKMLGMAGGSVAAPSFTTLAAASIAALTDKPAPAYTNYKDIWRNKWMWDKVVPGTHLINCWYQSHCAWDVYVRDGLVYREEQMGEYPQTNPDVPDFNPRGCQKGCSFSQRMYDPTRVTHPLKRVGERGEGKWQRVSWDDALTDIADRYLDVTLKEGTDRTIWDIGPGMDLGSSTAAVFRFSKFTRSVLLDINTEIGDGHRGALETLGKISGERSADDFFYSDLILIWGSNPIYTQIPNAHFYTEAKYNGTKLIAITPDYNPSATKADLWVPVKPGSDAALALGVAHLLIKEDRIDHAFVAEQTDMPFLVRTDTKKFLVAADLRDGDGKEIYQLFDETTGEIVDAPNKSLSLNGIEPRLDVHTRVRLRSGEEVEVRSVFSLTKERLLPYTEKRVAELSGVGEGMLRRFTKEIANAKAVSNITSSSLSKYYHGNLIERATILIFALTGNMGRHGAGYSGFPFLTADGFEAFTAVPDLHHLEHFMHQMHDTVAEKVKQGKTQEMALYEMMQLMFSPNTPFPQATSATLFWAVHGGVQELAQQNWDPFLSKPVSEYIDQAVDDGDQPLYPPKGKTPRIIFSFVTNTLRRVRGADKLKETLWPELDLSVVLDMRMNTTAKHADYVLPCAGWYERTSHKWVTPLSPFITLTTAAVPPLGESKTDWEIVVLLSKYIQKRAKERGIGTVKSPYGEDVALDKLYDNITMNGEFTEKDDEKVMKSIVELSSNLKGVDWDELKKKGFARYTATGNESASLGNMCEIKENETIVPHTYHVRDKIPWPTSTRRMQFYLDHDRYLEFDEALPSHKEPPTIGGDYPFMLTGGHPRESIHSTWRDNPLMLQLTRGGSFILVSSNDAKRKGVEDGDYLRVFNDVGEFHVRAKVSPSLQDNQMLMYHAWEDHQFRKGNLRSVTPSPINPVELVGNSGGHLDPRFSTGQASTFDRDTRVDFEKIDIS